MSSDMPTYAELQAEGAAMKHLFYAFLWSGISALTLAVAAFNSGAF